MSYVITGAGGQLGQELQAIYPEAEALTHDDLDISDAEAVAAYDWSHVNVLINAAAFNDVDGAEVAPGYNQAWAVNALGTQNLAETARAEDLKFVTVSTDYVFDGTKEGPYREGDETNPQSRYATTKAAGELAVWGDNQYLVRTSWVVGNGSNFVRAMLGLHNRENPIDPDVVKDQKGRPAFAVDLARAINHLLESGKPGTYHMSNSGDVVSRAEFAEAIFEEAGYDRTVTPVTTEEYYRGRDNIANRPANSAFDLTKLEEAGFVNRDWRQALSEYIAQELN